MRHCILNLGSGSWYPRGTARLKDSLKRLGFAGDVHCFSSESQVGSPPHSVAPYAFKVHVFEWARKQGYDVALWCDSSVWAYRNPTRIFDHIEREGHVLFTSGYNCGQWTSDACLGQLNVTRDEAKAMDHYMACCMGLDLRNSRSLEFLRKMAVHAADGISFQGPWTNDKRAASSDPYCLGHRHDQAVGSILAHQLGMKTVVGHETYFAYYPLPEMADLTRTDPLPVYDSVELLAQGL